MKKIRDWLEAKEAALKARKAASKAHWRSIGTTRQIAYYGVIAVSLVIAITGVLTQTIHTAFLASLAVLFAQPLILREGNWRRGFAISASGTLLIFPLALILGGMTLGERYEDALRDQSVVQEHSENVGRDAAEFLANYRAGNVRELGRTNPDLPMKDYDANDSIGYGITRRLFGFMHTFAPAEIDPSPILPLAEFLFADQVITLFDENLSKRRAAETNAALEIRFGKPIEDVTHEERWGARPEYGGIYGVVCFLNNTGDVLMATGLPAAHLTDLRKVPGAEPFVEVCQSLANDQATFAQAVPPSTKVSWR